MRKSNLLISFILAVGILIVQAGGAFAGSISHSSALITGTVQKITLEKDPSTGVTTILVEIQGKGQSSQTVRLSQETAIQLGLVTLDVDGLVINDLALGGTIEINPASVIPLRERDRHPVGNALATFFSDIAEEETLYTVIMDMHENGVGFGVIAQALWLTKELPGGDLEDFEALLLAKQTGDYNAFTLEDGTAPKNWGQLRRAIWEGKKAGNLGSIMSNKDDQGNGNDPDNGDGKPNDKGNQGSNGNKPGNDKGKGKNK
jgi:hypothetical protein